MGTLISLESAADRLGVTPRTIRNLIARGELKGFRIGQTRMLRVDQADVEQLARPIPAA